jgi:murein DD-endopeptidase MepM/ murein hydrolase activator NlpD
MTRLAANPASFVVVMILAFVCRAEASEPDIEEFVGPPAPVQTTKYLKVSVERSLEATFVAAVEDQFLGAQLAQVTKRVLIWWIDVRRHLYPGDVVEIVYEEREDKEPLLQAVWFTSGKLGGTRGAVLYKPEDGRFARWYDEKGREVERRLKHGPLASYEQITSLLSDGRRHRGVDFKVPIGEPIRAPFDGRVVRRNWSRRRNGTCLHIVDRSGRTSAYFLHLSRVKGGMRPGARVKRGQIIAFSGNTGRSSAPHLHYQLEKNERVIDPFRYHATWRASLSKAERTKALRLLARLGELRTRSS